LVEWKEDSEGVTIQKVQLAKIEKALHIPPEYAFSTPGNWMWCSPETHARANMDKPSDMFSFALVVTFLSPPTFFLKMDVHILILPYSAYSP